MLFDICSISEQNAQDFIKKYGKINDKEFAIQMLCLTSNAWFAIDDELKKLSEVIMYYQPAIVGRNNEKYISQKGFKLTNEKQPLMIPDISLPDDFDLNTYFDIQKSMPIGSSIVCKDDTKKLGLFELSENILVDVFIDAYDRSMLASLIDKYNTIKERVSK